MKFRTSIIACCITLIFLASPTINGATPIPDTGQTKCYNNTVEIPCPQPGEPFYGQDANYTINSPSYTDLGNGIVRDNVTGLEWQQATAPGTYTWEQALTYCENLTLADKSNWRLPTAKELASIEDYSYYNPPIYNPSIYAPSINTTYFPSTIPSPYWSSTPYAYSPDNAWVGDFYSGFVYYFPKAETHFVRAVRGGQIDNSFIDNGDGTVSDTSTGLMWQQATAPGTYTWEQALTYCENLTLADKSDWRLPTAKELASIVDYSCYNPSINTTYFPGTEAAEYWSSTTYVGYPNSAWYTNFYYGIVNQFTKSYYHSYVRAVRGGQSGSTVINLSCFTATPMAGKVILQWNTETEIDNAGFNIYRSGSENGEYIKINSSMIPAKGSATSGASYEFTDTNVQNRKTYYYKLEDSDFNGTSTFHGPVSATPRLIYGWR